jgi:hypothetical protein
MSGPEFKRFNADRIERRCQAVLALGRSIGSPIPGNGGWYGRCNISPRRRMRDYTTKEKLKITAGAVCAIVIVGWLVVFAIAVLAAG